MEEETQKAAFTLNHIDSSRVLSIDYSDEERLFGILLTNRNLCFVEDGEMQKNHGVIRSSGNEVEIRYLPLHRLWVLESVNSTLQVFSSPKSALLASRIVFRPHEEPITGIREVGSPLTLCTASLDGILKLWQISSGRLIIELDVRKERNE
jgi:WD40 repeat protein